MADQKSPASRRTGTGRYAPHQLQESDMETAQRSLTDQFQQVQRRAQQLMESMNIPGAPSLLCRHPVAIDVSSICQVARGRASTASCPAVWKAVIWRVVALR